MKKLLSALISAAFIATPLAVISTPAAAQSVLPTTTSSMDIQAKAGKGGKSHKGKKVRKAK